MIQLISGKYLTLRPAENIGIKKCRPEINEQVDFVSWVREHWPDDAALMIHPANEGKVSAFYRQQQAKAGMLKGASDILLMRSGWRWPSALIEFKRCAWSTVPSAEQKRVLELAAADGKFAAVVNGLEAAKVAFILYKKGFAELQNGDRLLLPLIDGGGK